MAKTIFEEMGGTYRQEGDRLIPNIECPQSERPIGKYGRMRKNFLKEQRPELYNYLLITGQLPDHLSEIDKAANDRLEEIIPKLAAEAGVTEQLKQSDQMRWVGLMNACKAQVEEIILNELVYS